MNFTIFDVARGLRRNWFTVFKWTFGVTLLVMVITILVPKTYSSKSKLLVNLGRENIAVDPSAAIGGSGVLAMPLSREAEINSVAEMMTNNELYYAVVADVGPEYILEKKKFVLEQWQAEKGKSKESKTSHLVGIKEEKEDLSTGEPSAIDKVMGTLQDVGVLNKVPFLEKAVIEFRKNLIIEPVEKSNIVTVQYECHDPVLAQLVVKTFVDKYKAVHSKVHRPTGSFGFLEQEMGRVAKEMKQKQKAFEDFKRQTGLLDVAQQKAGLIVRLQKAEEQSDIVQTDIKVLAEEIKELEKNLEKIDKLVVQEQITGAGNRAIDQLQVTLAEKYRKLDIAKRVAIGSKKTQVKILSAEIKALEERITNLKNQKETRMGANKVYADAKTSLEAKKPRLVALKEKEIRLANKIGELSGLLKIFTKDEKDFEKHQVDVILATEAYKKVAANLQQAKIDKGRQSDGISNISEPQAPSINHKPVSPNKLINLIAGLFLGGVLGCGLAVLKEYRLVASQEPERRTPVERISEESAVVENTQVPAYQSNSQTASAMEPNRVPVHQGSNDREDDEDLRDRPAEWSQEAGNQVT